MTKIYEMIKFQLNKVGLIQKLNKYCAKQYNKLNYSMTGKRLLLYRHICSFSLQNYTLFEILDVYG